MENPIRTIVSAINSPTDIFDKWLPQLFTLHFTKPGSHTPDSLELKTALDDLNIPHNDKLVSFDVVSLFINIPIDLINQASLTTRLI